MTTSQTHVSQRSAAEPITTYKQISSAENAGLSLAAYREVKDPEELLGTICALTTSPVYALAVAVYRHQLAIITATDHRERLDEEDFALRLLCARMFHAGMEVRRSEVSE